MPAAPAKRNSISRRGSAHPASTRLFNNGGLLVRGLKIPGGKTASRACIFRSTYHACGDIFFFLLPFSVTSLRPARDYFVSLIVNSGGGNSIWAEFLRHTWNVAPLAASEMNNVKVQRLGRFWINDIRNWKVISEIRDFRMSLGGRGGINSLIIDTMYNILC